MGIAARLNCGGSAARRRIRFAFHLAQSSVARCANHVRAALPKVRHPCRWNKTARCGVD